MRHETHSDYIVIVAESEDDTVLLKDLLGRLQNIATNINDVDMGGGMVFVETDDNATPNIGAYRLRLGR